MTEERVVDTKEVEDKMKKCIDEILKKSIPLRSFRQTPSRIQETDLDEKEKQIFCYIKNNPGAIKENVVVAFIKKPGYSRKPVFRAIKRLEHKHHLILIEPDKANRQIHHLFINRENELGSLIVDLDSFKQAYFDLIDKTNSFLNDNHVVFTGIKGLVENLKLVNAILTPFKFILSLYTIFDLFLPHENLFDNESLHRRFALIYITIKELQSKLYENFFKEPRIKLDDKFFTNTYLYDNLGFLNNILHSTLWGSNYENIKAMLITFNKYELRESAEEVMDCLWKFISPVFPIMYPRYSKEDPDLFKDWRKVIINFPDFDTATQVLAYRNIITEFSPSPS